MATELATALKMVQRAPIRQRRVVLDPLVPLGMGGGGKGQGQNYSGCHCAGRLAAPSRQIVEERRAVFKSTPPKIDQKAPSQPSFTVAKPQPTGHQ